MGSTTNTTEEDNKLTSLYASSSPSHPLLSKPPSPYPPIDEPTSTGDPSSDPTQYLLISYNSGPRPFRDLPFLLLFSIFVLSTFAFGIFSVVNSNPNYSSFSSYHYDSNSTSCVKDESLSLSFLGSSDSSGFLKALIWVLVITFCVSVPICFILLLSLKHYTKQVVYICFPFFIVVPIFFNVYWFVACTVSSSCSEGFPLVYRILVLVFVFLVIGILVWILVVNWHRVELTIMIIGVASDALSNNLGLFVALPLMTLGLLIYYAPIVVFLVFARFNGEFVVSESDGEYSCKWKQDSWVSAYYALGIITMLWSFTVMVEAQIYVISGTVAQWYFAKDESAPKRRIRSSMRNAFGPSSGTICLSGLLICAVRMVRAAVESARAEDATGIVHQVLRCCVNVFLSSVEFVNKFTINFAAITGEAYCTSARMTYELLKRNLLSAVFVETISSRLLGGIIFVLSAIYAIAACAILEGVSSLGIDSYFVAVLAWALLIMVLGYFIHVLDNVIDTIYICYAIDRDNGEFYKPSVHEVYVRLPISRNRRLSIDSTSPVV